MKRTARLLSFVLVVVLCLSVLPLSAAAVKDGWEYSGDIDAWYYYEGGSMVTGWKKISGVWYYFSPDYGNMYSDCWLQYPDDSNIWYYFKSNGAMATSQWVGNGDYWYYQLSDGKGAMGWKKIGGVWYYFDPDTTGMMAYDGPYGINGQLYYFKPNGALYTGWKKLARDDGHKYWAYFTSNGAVYYDWKKIDGKWYYFDGYEMATGGPWPIGGGVYLFNSDGSLFTGWKDLGWGWMYFTSSGAVEDGWKKIDGKWYYFDSYVILTGGPHEINGKDYYFNDSGSLYTGWKQFYTNPHDDSYYWMYFTSNGAYANTTKTINGKSYKFDSDGWCLNP